MPASAHSAAASASESWSAVIWLKLIRSVAHCATPASSRTSARARGRQLGVAQEPRRVGEHEELAEVRDRAGRLAPADHAEVVLVAVEVGEEDDARLVVVGGRREDVARERDRRREHRVVGRAVARVERLQRRRRGGRDRVEDAEQGVAVAVLVAGDQLGVVEVVARVELHAVGQPPAQRDLALVVEQGDLHAVDLRGVVGDHREHRLARRVEVGVAPVSGERGVEHRPEPVQDRRALEPAEHVRRTRARSRRGRVAAAASARLAIRITCAPAPSTNAHCSS